MWRNDNVVAKVQRGYGVEPSRRPWQNHPGLPKAIQVLQVFEL
jgi:hypothetical protein